ncbi:MAG: branched-chain amino acid aminotransferase [Candidatus Marinimicrobia bacterium]|nr:branched-chain amino acid aminotransferase [Candidatus Neomarinimicrobiota bacterium]
MDLKSINWKNLDFGYRKAPFRFHARWKEGQWESGRLVEDDYIRIEESATALHYGQQCFEGMKAQRSSSGKVYLFRPEENGKRMQDSARRLMMPEVPLDLFLKGINEVVRANIEYVPPYGFGASLYLRPMLIGTGHNLGVKPAPEYLFAVFVSPVGPYFKEGFKPIRVKAESYFDRAAPHGIGHVKAGGNYSAGMLPVTKARQEGYAEVVYLDAKEHRYFEELGAANIFFILNDNTFVTPKSDAILPSVTRRSIMEIAEKDFGIKVEERPFGINEISRVKEVGACGTAAVITPIGEMLINDETFRFYDQGKTPGPITEKLYKHLTSLQVGDIEDNHHWLTEVK